MRQSKVPSILRLQVWFPGCGIRFEQGLSALVEVLRGVLPLLAHDHRSSSLASRQLSQRGHSFGRLEPCSGQGLRLGLGGPRRKMVISLGEGVSEVSDDHEFEF